MCVRCEFQELSLKEEGMLILAPSFFSGWNEGQVLTLSSQGRGAGAGTAEQQEAGTWAEAVPILDCLPMAVLRCARKSATLYYLPLISLLSVLTELSQVELFYYLPRPPVIPSQHCEDRMIESGFREHSILSPPPPPPPHCQKRRQ